MKRIKKVLVLLVAGLLAVSMAACGGSGGYKTVEDITDAMKDADKMTISYELNGNKSESVYDGDKVKTVATLLGEETTMYIEFGDTVKVYTELNGKWIYMTGDDAASTAASASREEMADFIASLDDAELEKDGDTYVVRGKFSGVSAEYTIKFSGSVELPKDAEPLA